MSERITNYIPISRKLFDHVFFSEKRTFSKFEAWIDLIQEARYESREGKRLIGGKVIKIQRGEIPASLRFLAERWGWSRNKVDSFIKLLESEQMITKRTAEGTAQTIITICKYDTYNPLSQSNGTAHGTTKGQGRDSEGTAQGQSSNTVNKGKELKEGEDAGKPAPKPNSPKILLDERKKKFYKDLAEYVPEYGKVMVRAFYDYWSEPNKSRTKMKWELERTWDLHLRLKKWRDNDDKWSKPSNVKPLRHQKPDARAVDVHELLRQRQLEIERDKANSGQHV